MTSCASEISMQENEVRDTVKKQSSGPIHCSEVIDLKNLYFLRALQVVIETLGKQQAQGSPPAKQFLRF